MNSMTNGGVNRNGVNHDEDYCAQRERLIPIAVQTANESVGTTRRPGLWNRVFHSTMHQLAYEQGLISYDPSRFPPTKPVVETVELVKPKAKAVEA